MTVEQIMRRLDCREFYAQKMINSCETEEELQHLVAIKDHERQTRPAIVEVK